MKFSELPNNSYFVVVQLKKTMPILIKDRKGNVRKINFETIFDSEVTPETEVQPIISPK